MQDGFTTNNTRPEKRQKCNRRSALFLLSSSPILTVHVRSLRRSDILLRPELEYVSSENSPTFRQNYIKLKAFRNEATLRNRGDLPAVCCAGRASPKKSLLAASFNFVSTTQHVHEVLFRWPFVPTHARKKVDVHFPMTTSDTDV